MCVCLFIYLSICLSDCLTVWLTDFFGLKLSSFINLVYERNQIMFQSLDSPLLYMLCLRPFDHDCEVFGFGELWVLVLSVGWFVSVRLGLVWFGSTSREHLNRFNRPRFETNSNVEIVSLGLIRLRALILSKFLLRLWLWVSQPSMQLSG